MLLYVNMLSQGFSTFLGSRLRSRESPGGQAMSRLGGPPAAGRFSGWGVGPAQRAAVRLEVSLVKPEVPLASLYHCHISPGPSTVLPGVHLPLVENPCTTRSEIHLLFLPKRWMAKRGGMQFRKRKHCNVIRKNLI